MKVAEVILLAFFITSSKGTQPFPFNVTKSPVEITSKQVSYSIKDKRAYFSGDVKIVQDDLTISCERGVAHLDEQGKIEKITLTGSVKIVREDLTIIADSAEFLRGKNLIIVKGNPRVWKGKDFIKGDKIVYDIKLDQIIVEKASILLQQKK